MVNNYVIIMMFELFFDLGKDFIFGFIFAKNVDHSSQNSPNILNGSFLEMLGHQNLYSYRVSSSLPVLWGSNLSS